MVTRYKLIGILVLVVLGLLFYWFQIRPSEIKAECANRKSTFVKNIKTQESFNKYILDPRGQKATNDIYQNCLHSKGL